MCVDNLIAGFSLASTSAVQVVQSKCNPHKFVPSAIDTNSTSVISTKLSPQFSHKISFFGRISIKKCNILDYFFCNHVRAYILCTVQV